MPRSKYPKREPGFGFGHWTVGEAVYFKHDLGYVCKCACGAEHFISRSNLELGKTSSCNLCAAGRRDSVYLRFNAYPREAIDRLANRYYAITSRCRPGGHARYAGRGIQCTFSSVYEFVEYCLSFPGWDDPTLQIDRRDNSGNYCVGNLRFVSSKQNNRNKESLRLIEYNGETMCAAEFHERFCPRYRDVGNVGRQLRKGLSPKQIIANQSRCRGAYA